MELEFESGLWVRISYGTIKYVVESVQDNTEILVDPHEDQVPQTSIKVVAVRSKAKAKPLQREPVDITTTIPMHERRWIDIEPSEQTLAAYDLSKKVISLLRHNQTVQREKDGAIEFYRIKFYLRNHQSQVQHWSFSRWKACLAAGGGSKRRCQYCSDNSERLFYLRALQGHSGNNLIDPTLQDNLVIGSGLFHYINHIGCTLIFTLLSTMDWYLDVKIWAEDRQYSSCPLIQETQMIKILNILTSLYHVEHGTCTVHVRGIKTRYSGSILILRSEKGKRSIKHDQMQLFFKGHFQPIAFSKLKDWKLERCCMKDDICLLDHHQSLSERRSQLDQREWSIGFYSWTTVSRETRSTVFWRSTTC